MKIIDKLAWIEIKDRKILSTRSKGKDTFYFPGGKREKGESDAEALIREIQEELDVTLSIDSLSYLGTFEAQAHGHPDGIRVKMQCYTGTHNGTLKASAEIAEFRWLSYKDKAISSPVDHLIFDYLKDKNLID